MSDTKTRYMIEEGGQFYKIVQTRTTIEVLPALEAAFQANATFRIKGIVDFSTIGEPFFGMASITACTAQPETVYWSIRVRTLNLHTAFELKDGVLTPDFDNHADTRKVMEIPWRMPEDMWLMLGMVVEGSDTNGYKLRKHYLVAYDGHGRSYRLPLANLYDHLELCHGQDLAVHKSALKAIMVGLEGFRKSLWNADLFHEFQKRNAPKMFRFKPVNTGFEQLPIEGAWISLCEKVSSDLITTKFMGVFS